MIRGIAPCWTNVEPVVAALEQDLTEKQKTLFQRYSKFSIPAHLSKTDIEGLVDGCNYVTFSNFSSLVDQSKRWLIEADAARFAGRTAREMGIVNALIAVRNHLAHQSERSLRAMNDALVAGGLHLTGLKRGQNNVHHVGAYLNARVTAGNVTRLQDGTEQRGQRALTLQ